MRLVSPDVDAVDLFPRKAAHDRDQVDNGKHLWGQSAQYPRRMLLS